MTPEEAWKLWRLWYGTAETRKPPDAEGLRRWLKVSRETWDEAVSIVQAAKEEHRKAREGMVEVFICGRDRR